MNSGSHLPAQIMVVLTTCDNSINAHLLKNILENEGIECYIVNEYFSTLMPHFYGIFGSGVQVKVKKEDLQKAREIAQLDEEKVTCPNCGSINLELNIEKKKDKFLVGIILLFLAAPAGNLINNFECKDCGIEFKK
jgi:predicted RNA-binding Zn-ribbon protein involved in translation (DUF1610 family)